MLGLLAATDARWVDDALADLDGVLRDHAHCEMKAASNALSLATRWHHNLAIVRRLVALAQEELVHFERVLVVLSRRGIELGPPPVDTYAAKLRENAAKLPHIAGEPSSGLVDRLIVCALIEARSCERFKILAARIEDRELRDFYDELFAAEARHFREFIELAETVVSAEIVEARLHQIAAIEAEIVRTNAHAPARATIHG